MCGIIGIASNKPVSINILNSLKKLEYRGYDSAGIATLKNNLINEKKCSGRVDELEKILFKSPSDGIIGIGSGGNYALAAAKVLAETDLSAEDIARKSIKVASDICVFTNNNVTVEKV